MNLWQRTKPIDCHVSLLNITVLFFLLLTQSNNWWQISVHWFFDTDATRSDRIDEQEGPSNTFSSHTRKRTSSFLLKLIHAHRERGLSNMAHGRERGHPLPYCGIIYDSVCVSGGRRKWVNGWMCKCGYVGDSGQMLVDCHSGASHRRFVKPLSLWLLSI